MYQSKPFSPEGVYRLHPAAGQRKRCHGDGCTINQSMCIEHNGGTIAGIYVASFDNDTQGGELINSQNVLVPQQHKIWRIIKTGKTPIYGMGNNSVKVDESILNSNQRDLLVLRWYRIGSKNTANTYYAKWLQLLKRFSGDTSPELMIVLYTEAPHNDYQQAREHLQKLAAACCG